MSLIHRACDDVYSSFASSAFARASTVERNVRSRLSKLRAFVSASRAWLAIPARSSSSRERIGPSATTARAARPWSSGMKATACVAPAAGTPTVFPISAASSGVVTNGAPRGEKRATSSAGIVRPWRDV